MTDTAVADRPRPNRDDRAAAIARAKALAAAREQSESATGPPPADATPAKSRRKHSAAGGRIMVAGMAASAGLLMIGTMAAAARSGTPDAPQVVERVIVVQTPAAGADSGSAAATAQDNVTIVREVRVLPSAPADAAVASSVTTSNGS